MPALRDRLAEGPFKNTARSSKGPLVWFSKPLAVNYKLSLSGLAPMELCCSASPIRLTASVKFVHQDHSYLPSLGQRNKLNVHLLEFFTDLSKE